MKKILIADPNKASLVMTSEVFKENYPGIQVMVAKNATDALDMVKKNKDLDACVVDFDLPDTNGAKAAFQMKRVCKIPILITAFENESSSQTIEKTLQQYEDCQNWLKKPVEPEVVTAVMERFCAGKMRSEKRFDCEIPFSVCVHVLKKETYFETVTKRVAVPALKVTDKKVTSKSATKEKTKTTSKAPQKNKAKAKVTYKLKKVKVEKIRTVEVPLLFSATVMNCSLHGVKLKPKNVKNMPISRWKKFLEELKDVSRGQKVKLHSFWLGKRNEMNGIEVLSGEDLEKLHSKSLVKETAKTAGQTALPKEEIMTGKVAWCHAEKGEWHLGVELDELKKLKLLLEKVVDLSKKNLRNQAATLFNSSSILRRK